MAALQGGMTAHTYRVSASSETAGATAHRKPLRKPFLRGFLCAVADGYSAVGT